MNRTDVILNEIRWVSDRIHWGGTQEQLSQYAVKMAQLFRELDQEITQRGGKLPRDWSKK